MELSATRNLGQSTSYGQFIMNEPSSQFCQAQMQATAAIPRMANAHHWLCLAQGFQAPPAPVCCLFYK